MLKFWACLFIFIFARLSLAANDSSQSFTLDGQLFHVGTETPLIDSNAKLIVQILDPSETCVLYEETQSVDTTHTNGYFTIQVGRLPGSAKRTGLDAGQTMQNLIQNIFPIPATSAPGKTCVGATYAPSAGHIRYFRISVLPSSGPLDTLTPDMVMDSVPSAIVAQSVQGLERTNILQTNTTAVRFSRNPISNHFLRRRLLRTSLPFWPEPMFNRELAARPFLLSRQLRPQRARVIFGTIRPISNSFILTELQLTSSELQAREFRHSRSVII